MRKKSLESFNTIFICYPDHIKSQTPLKTLSFFVKPLQDVFDTIHILPFFEATSDGGFAISDYYKVREDLGTWQDVQRFDLEVMCDVVLNHTSSKHRWLRDSPDFYIEKAPGFNCVFRPRKTPLFHTINTRDLWTTFSKDQVDLNYDNPEVLKTAYHILAFYRSKGIRFFRLDAIAYIAKQKQTTCVHLKKTHALCKKITRKIHELSARSIGEINFEDRIIRSYKKDIDYVYNFTLSAILAHLVYSQNSYYFYKWVRSEKELSKYIHFSQSHDGIGLLPLKEILAKKAYTKFIAYHKRKKTKISGDEYELNATFFSLTKNTRHFLAIQAILAGFEGVLGVYFNTLFGIANNPNPSDARDINRKRFTLNQIAPYFDSEVYKRIMQLLQIRKNLSGKQHTIFLSQNLCCYMRQYKQKKLLILVNVTQKPVKVVRKKVTQLLHALPVDLLTQSEFSYILPPFGYVYLN